MTLYFSRFTLVANRPPGDQLPKVNDIWQHVHVDGFVAVAIENCSVPVIGKVLEKSEKTIKIHDWKGSWNKKWTPWLNYRKLWTDELPKECVYLSDFELDADAKLQRSTKRQMKKFLKDKQI